MKIQIIKFESVDSTNNVALRRIKKGKIKPTLIIAKSQKKGRGQYGRKWISQKGNIFMTIYALSSGPGISGIAVVRISGKDTSNLIKQNQ